MGWNHQAGEDSSILGINEMFGDSSQLFSSWEDRLFDTARTTGKTRKKTSAMTFLVQQHAVKNRVSTNIKAFWVEGQIFGKVGKYTIHGSYGF